MNFTSIEHKLANQTYNEWNIHPCEFDDGFPKCLGANQFRLELVVSTLERTTYKGFWLLEGSE